jgi:azurin
VNDFEDANYVTTSANDGYGNNVVDISVDHIISKVTIIKKTATKTKNVEARDYVLAKFGVK